MEKKWLVGFFVFVLPIFASPNADAQSRYCMNEWTACNKAVINWGPLCAGSTICRNGVCGTFGPDNTEFGQKRVTVCQQLWAKHSALFDSYNWKYNQDHTTFCNLVAHALEKQKLCLYQ